MPKYLLSNAAGEKQTNPRSPDGKHWKNLPHGGCRSATYTNSGDSLKLSQMLPPLSYEVKWCYSTVPDKVIPSLRLSGTCNCYFYAKPEKEREKERKKRGFPSLFCWCSPKRKQPYSCTALHRAPGLTIWAGIKCKVSLRLG